MSHFQLAIHSHRIRYGDPVDSALAEAIGELQCARALLITTPGGESRLAAILGNSTGKLVYASAFTGVVPHVPVAVVDQACEAALRESVDGLIAFGGGSALDTAKAIAQRLQLPIIAVPTNYSGAEVTFNFGITEEGVKRTVVDSAVLARVVIYDPALFNSLPRAEAVCSGINAIAHAVEALYGVNANPLTSAAAVAAIKHLVEGLQQQRKQDKQRKQNSSADATALCIKGAWLCGEVLAHVGMALHHRICHVLGGTFGLPHAPTHTVMLPYSVDFNEDATVALEPLRQIYGGARIGAGMQRFGAELGAPGSLKQLGLAEARIEQAAELVVSTPLNNPRVVSKGEVMQILKKAWSGVSLGG